VYGVNLCSGVMESEEPHTISPSISLIIHVQYLGQANSMGTQHWTKQIQKPGRLSSCQRAQLTWTVATINEILFRLYLQYTLYTTLQNMQCHLYVRDRPKPGFAFSAKNENNA